MVKEINRLVTCPHCKQPVKVRVYKKGKEYDCPNCSFIMTRSTLRALLDVMWDTEIPQDEGWYWLKYRRKRDGKSEMIVCPAMVLWLDMPGKKVPFVCPARGPDFSTGTRQQWGMQKAKFYKIPLEMPDA
jgi:uncharacterized protein YbaR (Trm112 family)